MAHYPATVSMSFYTIKAPSGAFIVCSRINKTQTKMMLLQKRSEVTAAQLCFNFC
jgi:hypothetical protein